MVGEVPWSKSLKQWVQLVAFVSFAALAPALLGVARDARTWLRRTEVAWSIGLALSVGIALVQILHFRWGLPGGDALNSTLASNPSIASGSEELYLGQGFVGIARARGPFPEPLHLASYLLAAIPVTAAGALEREGWSRAWRWLLVAMAGLCLVLTFSRGAYLGAVVGVALVVGAMVRGQLPCPRPRVAWGVVLGATASAAVGASLLTGTSPLDLPRLLVDRAMQTLTSHDMSNLTRWHAWTVAADLGRAHPLVGVGWGHFGFHYYAAAGPGGAGAHFGWPVTNSPAIAGLG